MCELNHNYSDEVQRNFKIFCDTLNKDKALYNQVRHQFFNNRNANKRIFLQNTFRIRFQITLSEENADSMINLVRAYFTKGNSRKLDIVNDIKREMIAKQNARCVYCNAAVTMQDDLDHIIPWKYVGDELGKANFQVLCERCNAIKSDRMEYEIRNELIGGRNQ